MGLNANQKRAVEYLDGPLLVLAGPGTGKTQLLSEKVAYILKNTDTAPENILCLTFTESGAQNMRERLKTIVGRDGLKVNVSTYHVFGQEILSQYRNYSEDYGRRLDEVVDEVRQFKIVRDLQRALPGTDILKGDNVKDIISVISEAKAAGLSATDLEVVARQNLEDSEVISQAISPLLLNVVPRNYAASLANAYVPIHEVLEKYAEIPPILPTAERSIAGLARDLKTAMMEAESANKVTPLSKWKDAYFERDEAGNYRLKDRIANKKLLSLAKMMASYEEVLDENGWFDFDDMIEEAVKALKRDAGFRMTLSERYQVILLDEFQDTNPSQFAIIKQLTDYEKPLIMAVGDDDQAIYEFQGAMSTNLTNFQEHYGAEVIALTENYRSTQEILDFSHQIIAQALDRFADKELIAHKPDPVESQVERREFWSSDAEYAFVAKEIAKLIKKGVKQDQIAIISHKTKYFMPLLPFLKSYPEIKIAYEKRDDLFEDEAIHEILTTVQFVDDLVKERKTENTLLEIMSYPFWRLPMLEVVKCAGRAKMEHKSLFDTLADSENLEVAAVARFLADLAAKSFNNPLNVCLDYLMGRQELNGFTSPFLKYYTDKGEYETFMLYENLAALNGKIVRYCGEKTPKMADLVSMVHDYRDAGMALTATSPYREADEAVQVLSAHKAKGLEFEYVFIISADHMAWGKGKGNNNLLSLPKNLMQIRHTGTTDGEKLRVLYVALTRAKSHLCITNSLHDFNDKTPDRLEYFEEYTEDNEVISPFLPTRKVILDYAEGVKMASAENLQKWLAPYASKDPDMRAVYRKKVENYRLSATALTGFIDVVYAGPVKFFENVILNAPREPETEQMVYGTLAHKTFEAVTNTKISDEKAIEFFLAELEKQDLPSEMVRVLREKGPVDLAVSLAKFGQILHDGKAEVNLATEKIAIDGVPVTGKIDHIAIDEEVKTIEVYDFKTAGYHKEKWQNHATLYKYMLQLGFYKLLLNNSLTYKKYKVTKAHILFVTPDRDGVVYDKVYEYSDAEEKELVDLIRAVYREIKTLDFMDDPEIFVGPNEDRKLADIKQFVEKLLEKNA